ncbi:MAG: FixG Ig-like domain-containing protein, partial [Bacteroidia bacterium]
VIAISGFDDTDRITNKAIIYFNSAYCRIKTDVNFLNKTRDNFDIKLKVENYPAEIKMIGKDVILKKESSAQAEFFIIMDRKNISERKSKLEVGIYSKGEKIKTIKTNFLGPVNQKK